MNHRAGHIRAMIAELERLGVRDYRFETGGKHKKLVFRHGGRRHVHPIPWSAGDKAYATKKALADLRRMVGKSPAKPKATPRSPARAATMAPGRAAALPARITPGKDPWAPLRTLRRRMAE